MEATAELIMHAAGRHFSQRVQRHLKSLVALRARVVTKQEIENHGAGELGSIAKAAVRGIECTAEILEGGIQRSLVGDAAGRGRIRNGLELRDDIPAGLNDFGALFAPGQDNAFQERREAGTAVTIIRREIGAAEEGLQIRCEKNRHGPPATAGGGLDVGHIYAVDIGPLFAIHFDRHERTVDYFGDRFVLERFALHHVAPVAGGIADGEEDGLVFAASLVESLVAPGIPVDWIMGVLLKVGALFGD